MSLYSKTILVTGAACGLGRQITNTFLNRGSNVVLCDISATRLKAATRDLETQHQGSLLALERDVSNESDVESLVSATVRKFGRLDVVVNNAGIMDNFDPVSTCDKRIWDKVIAVNLTGAFLISKHTVRCMERQQQPGGLIINIGSNASFKGLSAGAAYTASKHGILALTRNTAGFYGNRGVFCVALLLGGMEDTNITDAFTTGLNQEGRSMLEKTQPGYRSTSSAHVAKYAAFLCESGIGKSANGSAIVINSNWPEA